MELCLCVVERDSGAGRERRARKRHGEDGARLVEDLRCGGWCPGEPRWCGGRAADRET